MPLSRVLPQLSWRWKVIFPLIGTTLLGILLLTFDTLIIQREVTDQNLRREAEAFGLIAGNAVGPLMSGGSVDQLHAKMSTLSQSMNAKLWIVGADGNIEHSSSLEEEGAPVGKAVEALIAEARPAAPASERRGRDMIVALPPGSTGAPGRALVVQVDQSEALRHQAAIRRHIIAVAGTWMILLSLVVLWVLRVLVHQPVLELIRKISRARRGDWRVAVSFANRKDEIGELGSDFNDMVRQLRENCQQCEHLHNVHLQQAAHMASIGELAAGLAHEIKNPLAGITGAIEIVRDELPAEDANRAILGEVQNECRRIKKTISDLLSYATPQPPRVEMRDLNATLEHAIQMIEHQPAGKNIRLIREISSKIPALPHDPDQMQQVFCNLLMNAVDAIRGDGEIRLTTRLISSPQSARTPPMAEIVVEDTGGGMAPEQLQRIFRPFFTTKPSGSGLGLAVTKRVIDQHGGTIQVESEAGRGTRFTIRLPVVPITEKVFTLV